MRLLALLFFTLFVMQQAIAQKNEFLKMETKKVQFDINIVNGFEFMFPYRNDKQIYTFSSNHFISFSLYNYRYSVDMYGGMTATLPTGYIIKDSKRNYKTAFGVGPVIGIQHGPFIKSRYFLGLDFAFGTIFYNTHYPPGGDFYNLMIRTGPVFQYQIDKSNFIGSKVLWLHVSNGQGHGSHNPFYESVGVSVEYRRVFWSK